MHAQPFAGGVDLIFDFGGHGFIRGAPNSELLILNHEPVSNDAHALSHLITEDRFLGAIIGCC